MCMSIRAIAHAAPLHRIASRQLDAQLGKPSGWIERRTGIRERPVASETEATSDLAVRAGQRALEQLPERERRVSLLLLATSTPDHLLPPTAPLVAHRLRLKCGAVDIAGACAGFLYALTLAASHVRARRESVLVIAANVLTRRVNPLDPDTVALFSDGAAAVVLGPADGQRGLLGVHLGADGREYNRILIPGGGSRLPFTEAVAREGQHLMRIDGGPQVFRIAVQAMLRASDRALADASLTMDDVDLLIPHQANRRIIERVARSMNVPAERTISHIEWAGNSSAASIPMALSLAYGAGRIDSGDVILMTAVGAGFVEAGVVWRW